MIKPLEVSDIERVKSVLSEYAKLDINNLPLNEACLYQYGKEDHGKANGFEMAYYEGGKIFLEMPLIGQLHNDVFAFTLLHELGHYDASARGLIFTEEEEENYASEVAVNQLTSANVLPSEQITILKNAWDNANNSDMLAKKVDQLLRNAGVVESTMLKVKAETLDRGEGRDIATAWKKRGVDIEDIEDHARIMLFNGD